jgi:dimethylhistidine N-methyltransferase
MIKQSDLIDNIAADTLKGLSSNPKFLLPKYFYDDAGSRIFQQIMHMPEYYLTESEHEIFNIHAVALANAFNYGNHHSLEIIELGSGDGLKTKVLLNELLNLQIPFTYIPIDISAKANELLVKSLKQEMPTLKVEPRTGDYFNIIKQLNGHADIRKVILFLGSNIGNFSEDELHRFMLQLSFIANKGDKVLIGFDLKKSPAVIMPAYADPYGHTARFNLNHLTRLNRELGAEFEIQKFEHYTNYNPLSGEVKSFLVSNNEHEVYIKAFDRRIKFRQWEPIFMEVSRKFDVESIERIANKYEFAIVGHYFDSNHYFANSLWVKK